MSDVITASSTDQQQPIRAGGRRNEVANLQLEVVAGVHRGVALTLDKADYRIGSSRQTDIVLSDRGIAPEHAVLHDEGATVRIDATGGEVSVEQKSIPMGYGYRVRLPAEIVLGEARLHLFRPTMSGSTMSNPTVSRCFEWVDRVLGKDAGFAADSAEKLLTSTRELLVNKPITVAGTLICSVLVVTALAFGLPQLAQINFAHAKTNDANIIDAGKNGADQDVTSTTAPAESMTPAAQAARNLGKRLAAAKIQTLRVSIVDGRLVVQGTLTKPQTLEWTAIQRWFDQTYGSHIVLTANVTDVDGRANPRLQLQAIWYGDHPYIITAEGEHYYQGAILDNGWVVREIAADHLLLAKDGDTVTLTY